MAIVTSKYQTDGGSVFKIRLDAAKVAVTGNTAPTGAITDANVEVEVSEAGSRRKFGLHPRGVRGTRIGTGADLNKRFSVFLPALTQVSLQAILTAGSFTYKGQSYTDLSTVAES